VKRLKKFVLDILVEGFFRRWYRFVNNVDKKAEVVFMNYGFADDAAEMTLDSVDEPNRYPIQLYHQLVKAHDLENKDILEIGCGRGGGLAFLTKTPEDHLQLLGLTVIPPQWIFAISIGVSRDCLLSKGMLNAYPCLTIHLM
jgi:hypothetical protein